MKTFSKISFIVLFYLFMQNIVFAQIGSICPFSADVCQQIKDLAQNIKDNSSYGATGINISPKTECCIKTYGADGVEKLYFNIGERVNFGMIDGTEAQWGYLGTAGPPNYIGPGRYNYTLGFSTEGTYLDNSCHAKLAFKTNPTNGSNIFFWVDQDNNCDNYQEYYGGNPTGQLWNYTGYYSYSTPGLKVITSIALPYYFTNSKYTVPMTFKIIAVGNQYKPKKKKYSWLVPIINSLLL